jgi:hypothetical protein
MDMGNPNGNGIVKFQIELRKEKADRIEGYIKEKIVDLSTRKDYVNYALSLFDWMIQQMLAGKQIAAIDQDTKEMQVAIIPVVNTPSVKKK